MLQERIAPRIIKVKIQFDRTNSNQVYDAIKQLCPTLSAKEFTPEIVEKFTPEDADIDDVIKTLRNAEYNRSKPKKAKRNYRSKGNRKHSPAEALVKATTFTALMEVA